MDKQKTFEQALRTREFEPTLLTIHLEFQESCILTMVTFNYAMSI